MSEKQISLSDLLPDEGVKKLSEAINAYTPENDLHQVLIDVLAGYKDILLEKGVDHEYLAYALEAQLMKQQPKQQYKPGMRVRVYDGSGENLLGDGTYECTVKVYFMSMPDGSLQSLENAELEPAESEIPEGAEVFCTEDNPKIRLDNGQVVYGCQVWWAPIEEKHEHHEGCNHSHEQVSDPTKMAKSLSGSNDNQNH